MENASKALIIAGAILLSIVLITLGVLIIGRGQEAIDKASIDDQVVSTWNQKFTQYAGNNKRGTDVNTLINSILSSNAVCKKNGETEKLITIDGASDDITATPDSEGKYTQSCTKATPGKKYNVTVTYGSSGYIEKVKIADPTT